MRNGTLFRIWLSIGLQSFGGGVTTMTLIRRTAVDRYRWITEDDFNRNWGLCQMAPGINLIALSILIGRQTAGLRGAAIATMGMVLPSAAITAMMTAGFVAIRQMPALTAVLGGLLPASIGLGLVTSLQMAKAPMKSGRLAGYGKYAFYATLLVASGALMYFGVAATPVILIGAGTLAAVENALRERFTKKEPEAV